MKLRQYTIHAGLLGVWLLAGLPSLSLAQPIPDASASPDTDAVQAGRRLYSKNCSHCHGFNMVNPGTVSFDLRKFPKEDPQRFYTSVKEGKGGMPAWKSSLNDEQIQQLWAYVQTGGAKP
jgi:mono/diheme cytochrome c family protein